MTQYETIAFEHNHGEHLQLRETVVDLCYSLLKVQVCIICQQNPVPEPFIDLREAMINITGKISSERSDLNLDGASIHDYVRIKNLDDVCKDLVASIQTFKLVAAQERITRMEAEMEGRIRTEVAKQFLSLRPYMLQDVMHCLAEALGPQSTNRRPASENAAVAESNQEPLDESGQLNDPDPVEGQGSQEAVVVEESKGER